MCGFIASFGLDVNQNDFKDALKHLSRRGPDSEGVWSEKKVFLTSFMNQNGICQFKYQITSH